MIEEFLTGITLPGMARKLGVEYPEAIYTGEVGEVGIGVRLKRAMLVPVAWIAERLGMGSVINMNASLYLWRKGR